MNGTESYRNGKLPETNGTEWNGKLRKSTERKKRYGIDITERYEKRTDQTLHGTEKLSGTEQNGHLQNGTQGTVNGMERNGMIMRRRRKREGGKGRKRKGKERGTRSPVWRASHPSVEQS